jgi:hypothetical protein
MADRGTIPARAAVAPAPPLILNLDPTTRKTAVKLCILLGSAIFRRYPPVAVRLSTAYAQKLWPTSFYLFKFVGPLGMASSYCD